MRIFSLEVKAILFVIRMNLIFFSKAIWRILVVVARTSSRRCSPESYVLLALLHPGPDLVWTIWWKWCELIVVMMMTTPTSSTLSWKCSLQASCWISGNACTRSLIIVTMTNWCRTEKHHHHRHHHHHYCRYYRREDREDENKVGNKDESDEEEGGK